MWKIIGNYSEVKTSAIFVVKWIAQSNDHRERSFIGRASYLAGGSWCERSFRPGYGSGHFLKRADGTFRRKIPYRKKVNRWDWLFNGLKCKGHAMHYWHNSLARYVWFCVCWWCSLTEWLGYSEHFEDQTLTIGDGWCLQTRCVW
jgi:hypothetical protein